MAQLNNGELVNYADQEDEMNKQANMQVVQRAYAAFGQGDIQGVLDTLADDVGWFVPGPEEILPFAGRRTGKKGVAQFFELVAKAVEHRAFAPVSFIAQNDKVVVLGREELRIRTTGRLVAVDWAMAFTLQNEKITDFREYTDTGALIEAFRGSRGAAAAE